MNTGAALRLEERGEDWVLGGDAAARFALVNEYLGHLLDRHYSRATVRARPRPPRQPHPDLVKNDFAEALGLFAPSALWLWRTRAGAHARDDPGKILGVAARPEVARVAGRRWLLHRARTLRPSLTNPAPHDLGYRLGMSRGLECFCSVEDSIVIVGPPRSGKGLHLVIPSILDAPGAVITTSTRPDNLTATLTAREATGPVVIFDPQCLAPGIPSAARWSPIRGCENPQTALLRGKALTTGAASGTVDSDFWQASSEQAVRCLLHAQGLGKVVSQQVSRHAMAWSGCLA